MGRGTTLGLYLKAISSSGWLLFLLLLHFHDGIITGASAAFPSSETTKTQQQKCDKVVLVETVELLSYLGNVTFTVPTPFNGRWRTLIKFTSPYTFIGGWGVEVQSFGRKGYAIFERNDEESLVAGDQVIFQFRVLYGRYVKVPKVLSIRWENVPICGSPISPQNDLTFLTALGKSSQAKNSEEDETDSDESVLYGSSDSDSTELTQEVKHHVVTNNVRLSNSK